MDVTCEQVARAGFETEPIQNGNRLRWPCPWHDDTKPSFDVNTEKNIAGCFVCDLHVTAWQLAAKFAEAGPEETAKVVAWLKEKGIFSSNGKQSNGSENGARPRKPRILLTPEQYSSHKNLPIEFLQTLLVQEVDYRNDRALQMTYTLPDGSLAPRHQIRVSLDGENKFFWDDNPGDIVPYGLNRLELARRRGYLTLVEGCSDAQTLWFHDEPALGAPGASSWKKEWDEYVNDIPVFYLPIEPDHGGQTFLRRFLSTSLYKRLHVTSIPGFKDVSELHCKFHKDPEEFKARWQETLERAAIANKVVLGNLLDEMVAYYRRFVWFSENQARIAALWAAHTHVFMVFHKTHTW